MTIKIEAFENGPFKLTGVSKLTCFGEEIKADEEVYLCRCGGSQKQPFCDGTHSKINFDDKNPEQNPKDLVHWQGQSIKTTFNPNICMHAGNCKPLKDLREKESSGGDAATVQEIVKVVNSCPSGAITFETSIENSSEDVPGEVEIISGGEVRIKSDFETLNFKINDGQPKNRATLCRCGLSRNKPYCDASHFRKKDYK